MDGLNWYCFTVVVIWGRLLHSDSRRNENEYPAIEEYRKQTV